MTINTDLLRRTLTHIETHPDTWDQRAWRCGTTMCFAGHAATLAGGQWADGPYAAYLHAEQDDPADRVILHGGLRLIYAQDRAQHVLGLDDVQAAALFASDNTLDALQAIVSRLLADTEVTG